MKACPTCRAPLITANNGSELYCPLCAAEGREPLVSRMTPAEPAVAVRGVHGARRGQPEARLVADIVRALRAMGRTVLRVGQWRGDLAGQTAGTPDLLCWCSRRQGWIGIEAKTAKGRLSPAQRELVATGKVRVVRSVEEAVEIVAEEARNL